MQNFTLQKFEGAEHKDIGNKAFKKFLKSNPEILERNNILSDFINLDTRVITLNEVLALTAGEWVALGGDFFGIPDRPITGLPDEDIRRPEHLGERKQRFLEAYHTLADVNSADDLRELKELLKRIQLEEDIMKEAIAAHEKDNNIKVSDYYHARTQDGNKEFASITAKSVIAKLLAPHIHLSLVGLTLYTRYLALLETNVDHFGTDAQLAYEAGHAVAAETARHAGNCDTDEDKCKQFLVALTQELFACHFLTDAFASGHLRVPRRQLCQSVGNRKVAGLLANVMHDEDGENGLHVSTPLKMHKNEQWFAKGDGCLYDAGVEENRLYAVDAVVKGLQHIYNIYCNPKQSFIYDVDSLLPRHLPTPTNYDPLFKAVGGTVAYRGTLSPQEESKYTEDWSSILTLATLWKAKKQVPDIDVLELASIIEEEVAEEPASNWGCNLL